MIYPKNGAERPRQSTLSLVQGLYCVASGLLLSGFGRRNWLRRSSGGMLTSVGATLILASMTRRVSPQLRGLALTTAGMLAGADLLRAFGRRSRMVHMTRGLLRLGMAAAWLGPALRLAEPEHAAEEEQLDEALEETFPASDPIAVTPPDRREALPEL